MPPERYSRQIATGLICAAEQNMLSKKTAAVVGLGALGSVSAELLLRSGVRNLILIDRDFVEESNLQRQRYSEKDIGIQKAVALKAHLMEVDSGAKICPHVIDIDSSNIGVLKGADIILDGCDNLSTRFLINDFVRKESIPWIYCAAIGTIGATMNIVPSGPCFSCVFGKSLNPAEVETCETRGIINPASTAIAALQVAEALKILTGKKEANKDLVYLDAWTGDLRRIRVEKNPSCDACAGKYLYLKEKATETIAVCGKGAYQIKPKRKLSLDLDIFAGRFKKAKILPGIIHLAVDSFEVSLFPDGRAIIRGAKTREQAHSIYNRVVGE